MNEEQETIVRRKINEYPPLFFTFKDKEKLLKLSECVCDKLDCNQFEIVVDAVIENFMQYE